MRRAALALLLLAAGCVPPERSGRVDVGFVRDAALPSAFRVLAKENIPAESGERLKGATAILVPETDELQAIRLLLDWRRSETTPSYWTRDEWQLR